MGWFPHRFLGPETKTVGGGGAAGGLSNNLISVLQKLLNGGGLGTGGSPSAPGTTQDIYGVLSDILKGANGNAGSAISKLLSTQQTRDINGLRSQFGVSGGMGFGTPAAYAESNYRAGAAPQITSAITGLQLQAISQLLPGMFGLAGRAIPQAEIVQTPGALDQILKGVGGAAQAYAGFKNPWGGGAPSTAPSTGGNGAGYTPGEQDWWRTQ